LTFKLLLSQRAKDDWEKLLNDKGLEKRLKAVRKALGLLEHNPRHPGLHTHKYHELTGKNGEDIFEAYAESDTPAAYRIFWSFGPGRGEITILSITPQAFDSLRSYALSESHEMG
jgi:hypothetical protein